MAMSTLAKPPDPLNLEDRTHRGENWKRFKRDWSYYEVAAKINKEEGEVRVAHLLNVIGKDAKISMKRFHLRMVSERTSSKFLKPSSHDVSQKPMLFTNVTCSTGERKSQEKLSITILLR